MNLKNSSVSSFGARNSGVQWPLLIALCGVSLPLFGQSPTELEEIRYSADIYNYLPGGGPQVITGDDAIVVVDVPLRSYSDSDPLGVLPQAGIDAHHNAGDGCGTSLFSLDTTSDISGISMRPADVFTAAGAKILDADLAGLPAGTNIDAVSRDTTNCDLLISVDTSSVLDGSAYRPDDVIRWNSGDGFSLYLATGIGVNIDALHWLGPERLLVSTDPGIVLPDFPSGTGQILELGNCSVGTFLVPSKAPAVNRRGAQLNSLWALPATGGETIFRDSFERCPQ